MADFITELEKRRKREEHLAINTPLTISISKSQSINLNLKSLVYGLSTSELTRLLIDVGAKKLGWDLEEII